MEPALGKKWKPGRPKRRIEDDLLHRYHARVGGLLFTEVNAARPVARSLQRRLDGLRFEGNRLPSSAYEAGHENYARIAELIKSVPAELIEIHHWGFYGLGQLLGKARLLRDHWQPRALDLVFIPSDRDLGRHPDPASEAVFDAHDIRVVKP